MPWTPWLRGGWAVTMPPVETFETTCWTVIQGAARGRAEDREEFALRYAPVLRSYLQGRWGDSPLAAHLDDAVQDVFVECFKESGVLDRADRIGQGSFRRFLYGVVRNVARRFEERTAGAREAPASAE
ncbi:MAG: sigma-70 family RNA polymerase sigma factor, partial [Planctomycetes bacterium]|nr:sigma-70 family RNA polymerase sigma factor [Planctomycetota bacterium]